MRASKSDISLAFAFTFRFLKLLSSTLGDLGLQSLASGFSPQIYNMASIRRSHPKYENRAPELLAVLWTFTTLALVVVLVKVYTRVKIIRETGLDDFLILFSMVNPTSRVPHFYSGCLLLSCFQSFARPFSQKT